MKALYRCIHYLGVLVQRLSVLQLCRAIVAGWRRHFRLSTQEQNQSELTNWMAGEVGQLLMQEESALLKSRLAKVYGCHLMHLSAGVPDSLFDRDSPILHHFNLGVAGSGVGHAQAQFECLPLADDSLDAVVLQHVLEFSPDPHQLLRESARVISSSGYLLIVAFNPLSFFGLLKLFKRAFKPQTFWSHRGLRSGRLRDWLRLLDFECVSQECGFFRPPLSQMGIMRQMTWFERVAKWMRLPFGGFYLIVARKHVAPLTPLKPRWGAVASVPGLVINPAVERHSASKR